MAIQTSGAISLTQIQTEFGGVAPISLTEYYGEDTVPSSGALSMTDFYGTSSVYSISGSAVPNSYTHIGGPTGNNSLVLGTVTDGNINTYVGQRSTSLGNWTNDFSVKNTDIKAGVQGKLGASVPLASDYASLGINGVNVSGYVKASFSGSFWTMDGGGAIYLLDDSGTTISGAASLQDVSITAPGQAGAGFLWYPFNMSLLSNLFPISNNMDMIAKWIHGGCNVRIIRTQGLYNHWSDIGEVSYVLDFSAA